MCVICQNELANFKARTSTPAWQLNRTHVADRLQEILNDPDSIRGGALSLSGIAAFLRFWVLRDHLAVVRFAITLYEYGTSAINGYMVEPCEELLTANYASIDWGEEPAWQACPPADWMIMCALQDKENWILDFGGTPDEFLSTGLWPYSVVNYFNATALYKEVADETDTDPKGVDHAQGLQPDGNTDIVLWIDADILPEANSGALFENDVPSIFIGLCSPMKISDTEITMKYFWGGVRETTLKKTDFRDNYYGAIVAKSKGDAMPLPFSSPPIPAVPTGFSARVSGTNVILSWTSASLNDTSYTVERRNGADFNSPGAFTVPATRPSTIGTSCVDDRAGKPDQILYYRVCANNVNGSSGYTGFLSVNLNTGEVNPVAELTLTRPPCYVKQVAVLRAPPGLQPSGFASLQTDGCDCLQPQVVYNAHWESQGIHSRSRILMRGYQPARPDRQLYFFVKFANSDLSPGVPPMDDSTVTVKLVTIKSYPQDPVVSVPVVMTLNEDKTYYWGSFSPSDAALADVSCQIEIHAEDRFDRVEGRTPSGHEIDSDPRNVPYVDTGSYLFRNYEPGIDRNHVLHISSIRGNLPADRFEANNSFASATRIALVGGHNIPSMGGLNLSDSSDIDYFLVEFQTTADDDAYQLLEPSTVTSEALGLSMTFYPPELIIELQDNDKSCLNLALHTSQALGLVKVGSAQGAMQLRLYNPVRAGFTDKKFFAVVSNADFDTQGAVTYAMRLSYVQAHTETRHAYKPRPTKARVLLKRLYDVIDLPRPGVDPAPWFKGNGDVLVRKMATFLLQPQTVGDLRSILKQNAAVTLARDYQSIGQVAHRLGLVQEAEKLLTASAEHYGVTRDTKGQISVLKDLQKFYGDAGMKMKADNIKRILKRRIG